MRIDKNTGQVYADFRDWLFADNHLVWIISLFFAVVAYYATTEEA